MTTSREHAWRAARALEVYFERGQASLACLERGDVDAATELLAKRQAAFYNFRALDVAACAAGINIKSDPQVMRIYNQLSELESQLTRAIVSARDQALAQYRSIRASRRKLSQGYGHSLAEVETRILQGV